MVGTLDAIERLGDYTVSMKSTSTVLNLLKDAVSNHGSNTVIQHFEKLILDMDLTLKCSLDVGYVYENSERVSEIETRLIET